MSDTQDAPPTPGVCTAFKHGLWQDYALRVQDINDAIYVGSLNVAGGLVNTNSTYVSFGEYQKHYPTLVDIPAYTDRCICGQAIVENCIIYSPGLDRVFTIGSECVKRFTASGRKRVCVTCHQPTRASTPQCVDCHPPTRCGGCGREVGGLKAVDTCHRCHDHTPCSKCGLRVRKPRVLGPRVGQCLKCAQEIKGHCVDCDEVCSEKFRRCYPCQTASKCDGCGKGCPQAFPTCWACSSRLN